MDSHDLYLRIGCVISVFSEEQDGYLHQEGLCTDRCGLQAMEEGGGVPLNFEECLFEVIGQYHYTAKKELQKFKKNTRIVEKDEALEAALLENVEKEGNLNRERNHENQGARVSYGDIIQLFHVKSFKFLTVDPKKLADLDKECCRVGLDEDGNVGSWFKIMPRFKMRQEGEPVYMGDQVTLYSAKTGSYLNATKNAYDSEFPRLSEVNCGPVKGNSWKMALFAPPNLQLSSDGESGGVSSAPVHIHDYVRFYHPENSGFLAGPTPKVDGALLGESDRAERVGGDANNMQAYLYRWADSNLQSDDVMHSKAIWILETTEVTAGGEAEFDVPLRIRCANTGLYLAIDQSSLSGSGNNEGCDTVLTRDRDSEDTSFVLKPTWAGMDSKISYRNSMRIFHVGTGMVLHCTSTHKNPNPAQTAQESGRVKPRRNLLMRFCKVLQDDDAFIILIVQPEKRDDIQQALAYQPNFVKHIKLFRDGHALTQEYVRDFITHISDTIFFFTDTVDDNALECKGLPQLEREELAREHKLIDLVVAALVAPLTMMKDQYADVGTIKAKNPRLFTVTRYLFKLLFHLADGHRRNELYVAKNGWIKTISSCLGFNCGAEETFGNLVANNRILLDRQIDAENVKYFVELIETRGQYDQYLQCLTNIVSCSGEAINSNQEAVLNELYAHPEKKNLLIKCFLDKKNPRIRKSVNLMEEKHGTVGKAEGNFEGRDNYENGYYGMLVSYKGALPGWDPQQLYGMKEVPLTVFVAPLAHLQSFSDDHGDKAMPKDQIKQILAEYFLAQIFLLAEIASDRSYNCIEALRTEYDFELLLTGITDPNLPFKIRAAFVRLMTTVYIDVAPLQPMQFPVYTRDYSAISEADSIKLPQCENSNRYHILEDFIADHFISLKGRMVASHVSENIFTLQILQLLKVLVLSGNYGSVDEFVELVGPLMTTLDGRSDLMAIAGENPEGYMANSGKKKKNTISRRSTQLKSSMKKASFGPTTPDSPVNVTQSSPGGAGGGGGGSPVASRKPTLTDAQLPEGMNKGDTEMKPLLDSTKGGAGGAGGEDGGEAPKDDQQGGFMTTSPMYVENDQTTLIMKAKTVMCEVLTTLADVRTDFRLSYLVKYYKKRREEKKELSIKDITKIMTSKESKTLDFDEIYDGPMVTVLMDLLMYQNVNVVDSALSNLVIHFSQTRTLLEQAKQMLFVADPESVAILKSIEKNLSTLTTRFETYEVWGFSTETKPFDNDGFEEVKKCLLEVTKLCQVDNKAVKALNQELLRNAGLLPIMRKGLTIDFDDKPEEQHLRAILKLIYKLLAAFCIGNKTNQKLMVSFAAEFLDHMEYNIGITTLYNAIFQGNVQLCSKISESVIRFFIDSNEKVGPQKKYINFLINVVVCGGEPIKRNQDMVLSIVTDPSLKKTMLLCHDPESQEYKDRCEWIQKGDANDDESLLSYHLSFIRLLGRCTSGKNRRAEAKIQNIYPYYDVLHALLDPKNNDSIFKKEVAIFFYDTYLDSELRASGLAHDPKIWEVFLDFLTYVKQLKLNEKYLGAKKGDSKEAQQDKNTVLVEFVFSGILPCYRYFFGNYFDQQSASEQDIQKVRDMLVAVKPIGACSYLNETQRQEVSQCIHAMETALKRAGGSGGGGSHDSLRLGRSTVTESDEGGGVGVADVTVNVASRASLSVDDDGGSGSGSKDKDKDKEEGDDSGATGRVITALFIEALERLEKEEEMSVWLQQEFDEFVTAILEIGEESMKDKDCKVKLSTAGILTKMIEHVRVQCTKKDDDADYSPSNCLAVLKAMGRMIERAAEDGEDDDERLENETNRQNELAEYGAATLVIDVLAATDSHELIQESISLGVKLLNNGNEMVQGIMYDYFLENPETHFFRKLRHLIRDISERSKLQRRMKKLKERQAQVRLSSGSMSSENSTDEDESSTLEEEASALLRFIQLFAEGHNTDMQNYMHCQFKARNSYDILQELISLLLTLEKSISSANNDIVNAIFDCLTEYCQGPCAANQVLIGDGMFLDTCNRMLADIYRLNAGEEHELKGAIVKTLLSLLENRVDNVIQNQMMAILRPRTLQNELVKSFQRFQGLAIKFGVDTGLPGSTGGLDLAKGGLKVARGGAMATFRAAKGLAKGAVNTAINPLATVKGIAHAATNPLETAKGFAAFAASLFANDDDAKLEWVDICRQEATDIYILIQTLSQYDAGFASACKAVSEEEMLVDDFFREKVAVVELSFNGRVDKITFPIPDMCFLLSDMTKDSLVWEVERDSAETKLADFMDKADDVYFMLSHQHKLMKYKLFALLFPRLGRLKDILFGLAITLNLVLLFTLVRREDKETSLASFVGGDIDLDVPHFNNGAWNIVTTVLSMCQISVTFIVTAMTILTDGYANMHTHVKAIDEARKEKGKPKTAGVYRVILQVYFIMTEKLALWYFLYLCIAVLGLELYYFVSLQLLDLLNRSPALANVTRAVTRPWKELVLTALLLFAIMYIYSIFSFYFLAPLWNQSDYDYGAKSTTCKSMLTCFLTAMDDGLLNGGGLGGMMTKVDINTTLWVPELIFALSYFIIVIIIGLNVVFGIIIDTFGSLREEYNDKLSDMKSVCFICSLEAAVFEKYSNGFKAHIKGSHSMWNYLFYMIYIEEKDPNDRNGPEDFVADCIEEQSIEFFPVRRALELQGKGVEGQDHDTADMTYDMILDKLSQLDQFDSQVQALMAAVKKLFEQ